MIDLPLIWAILLSIVIILYVILDGFDLGVGILFPWVKSKNDRDIMMTSISPVWDGNETWLVLGAAFLYGAFPIAYSTLLPTLYMPITIMLAALIFRGVAFEFRFKAKNQLLWDIAFCSGSTLAAFCQGVALGTFVFGYASEAHPMISEHYRWLTPFSFMTGFAVVIGYALLGSTWLIAKTVGDLQTHMYRIARICLIGVAFFMTLVSLWTPIAVSEIWTRWFNTPNFFELLPLPIITGIIFIWTWHSLAQRREFLPFWQSVSLFILAYIGFCISDWPYIIPRVTTIWQAAAPTSSLQFLLIGAIVLLPLLIGYTIYAYRVFGGKVTSAEHHY